MADAVGTLTVGNRLAEFSRAVERTTATRADGSELELEAALVETATLLSTTHRTGGNVYVVGNGGSAAIASHFVTDLVNAAGIRAATLHDSSLLSCLANDYGYDQAFARALRTGATEADVLVAVSSSGRSPNIVNAASAMRGRDLTVVTLSGFADDNPLRTAGNINLWLDSRDYGTVEIGHQFLLHNVTDRLAAGRKAVER